MGSDNPSQMEAVCGRLGHRPVGGDPEVVRTYAGTCTGISTTVDQLLPGLRAAAAATDDQDSEAVAELGTLSRKVTGRLATVGQRYGEIGTVLTTYVGALDAAQSQSWQAYNTAGPALDQIDQLQGAMDRHVPDSLSPGGLSLDGWPGQYSMPTGALARRYHWDGHSVTMSAGLTPAGPRDAWERAQLGLIADQYRAVDGAKVLMQGAWDTLGTAAATAVSALKALHDDGLDDGLRDNLAGWGNALHLDDVRSALADVGQWFWDHLDDINTIVGIAALVLCWVPVVGQVLAVTAAVLSAAVLVKSSIAMAQGHGSWSDIAIAAIGVATFGAGRATTTAIKVTSAARGAATGTKTAANLADDAARAAGAVESHGAAAPSVLRQAVGSLSPSAIGRDIVQEAKGFPASKVVNPMPEGFNFLNSVAGATGPVQMSNTEGLVAAWNIVNDQVGTIVTVGDAAGGISE